MFVHPYLRPRVEISSRVKHDFRSLCVAPASDSRNRGRRYYQKTLESGRSSARITILERETKVF
ncbi:hypothetical protein Taro_040154 [Colocasia esculenta]|uniref:Uncharacterized protein n=1 Tax=Colocasia esculenta TaxID=4460 RepID=A0A843WL01_COLES|nr:hypothetical protein [Colocasia esculenta]